MRFDKLDLNLLIVLDALLREGSVTLAAERINLSQSATSSALARLRQYFDDELLIVRGRTMVLTARAEELIAPVADVLARIRDGIATPRSFDPATSDRRLTIMASDYATEMLLGPTLRDIADDAPNMTFQMRPIADYTEHFERGGVDIAIAPDASISSEHPIMPLFSEDFVVIGWRGNRRLDQPMTSELYSALGHVVMRFGRSQVLSFSETVHRHRRVARRIEVVTDSFTSVATMVLGSQRIGTMPRRLAERVADQYELRLLEPPFDIPRIRLAAQWPAAAARDPAIAWLVERLRAYAATTFGGVD